MIRKPLRLLFLASISTLALAACQKAAPVAPAPETGSTPEAAPVETSEPEFDVKLPMMTCGPRGFITADATRDALAATFGAENLAEEDLPWADSTETALVLFPDEPATRVEMFWLGNTAGGPRYVRVGGDASQFIGPGGLFVGASLEDVEAANGGPFELMGFQNHNAGEVTDWLGGALAAKPGETCEFALEMDISPDLASDLVQPVSDDPEKRYRSDSPEMRAANPSVAVLALHYFDPS